MDSNRDENRISVECSLCGSKIFHKNNLTVDNNDEYFCDECIMDTKCDRCGTNLTLTKKRMSELGEKVICKSCEGELKSDKGSKEKDDVGILGGIGLYIGMGFLAMGIGTFYIITTGVSLFGPRHEAFSKILAPILFIGYLLFR